MGGSKFKVEQEKLETRPYKLCEFLTDKFHDGFDENLQVSYIRQMHSWSYYLFAFITYVIPPGVFLYFALQGYFEEISKEFISLGTDSNSG